MHSCRPRAWSTTTSWVAFVTSKRTSAEPARRLHPLLHNRHTVEPFGLSAGTQVGDGDDSACTRDIVRYCRPYTGDEVGVIINAVETIRARRQVYMGACADHLDIRDLQVRARVEVDDAVDPTDARRNACTVKPGGKGQDRKST